MKLSNWWPKQITLLWREKVWYFHSVSKCLSNVYCVSGSGEYPGLINVFIKFPWNCSPERTHKFDGKKIPCLISLEITSKPTSLSVSKKRISYFINSVNNSGHLTLSSWSSSLALAPLNLLNPEQKLSHLQLFKFYYF